MSGEAVSWVDFVICDSRLDREGVPPEVVATDGCVSAMVNMMANRSKPGCCRTH
jgi:hypothetical protein